jgi:hypothetical protein
MKKLIYLCFTALFFTVCILSCTNTTNSSNGEPETADEVARSIEKAIHKHEWDKTKWVHWIFPGPREHLWDRERNYTEIKWNDYKAVVDLNTREGKVYRNNNLVEDSVQDSLLQKAWGAHINDAFWLNAPAHLFDDGTERSLVDRDGKTCLKVEYTTGGVTPGDHYIWHYDDNYLPTAWEMYVSVISTPGAKATWENWITLESGAMIAVSHDRGERMMEMKEVKSGNSFKDFGRSEDPFGGL